MKPVSRKHEVLSKEVTQVGPGDDFDRFVREQRKKDPEFRKGWDALAIPRRIAIDIIRLRAHLGMTQDEFAEHVGLSVAKIRSLESGRKNPDVKSPVWNSPPIIPPLLLQG